MNSWVLFHGDLIEGVHGVVALFAEALRDARRRRGLSQCELARLMGVAQPTVARWEGGTRLPDIATITRLAECLGVDVGALLSTAASQNRSPNVIAVEDREVILSGSVSVLRKALPDAVVTGFRWPREAVAYARENPVSIAFLDIELRGESGLELCDALLEVNPHTNVVFLTAYPTYSLDAWATGACGFMLKPITVEGVLGQLALLRHPYPGVCADGR